MSVWLLAELTYLAFVSSTGSRGRLGGVGWGMKALPCGAGWLAEVALKAGKAWLHLAPGEGEKWRWGKRQKKTSRGQGPASLWIDFWFCLYATCLCLHPHHDSITRLVTTTALDQG